MNNGLYFWAWCSCENYYVGKKTQRFGCPERKSRIWEKLNKTPLAQIKENKMKNKLNNPNISNAILWAAAILSSAIFDAPQFLTIIILPLLGVFSIINVKRCS